MMFGAGLIVFRETLEAALLVGIVAASTRGLVGRTSWLVGGVVAGAIGAMLIAGVMQVVSAWADGLGQDLMTAATLTLVLFMLAWHCIWVSPQAHQTVAWAQELGAAVQRQSQSLWALSIAVAMAVFREGVETVLFVTGLLNTGTSEALGLLWSLSLGLAAGVSMGWLIYAGLTRLRPQRLFAITHWLILFMIGHMASQLAKTLVQANWVTILTDSMWDISDQVAPDGLIVQILQGVIGFDVNPMQLQVMAYVVVVFVVGCLSLQMTKRMARHSAASKAR